MTTPHLAFMVLINLIWGFALVAGKGSLEHFPPFLFMAIRFGLVALVLLPFLSIHWGRMRDVILIALCAGPIGFGFFFAGLAIAEASVVAIASQMAVPISTIFSVMFLGERIRWRRWLGITLAFLGVMVISFDPRVFSYIEGLIFVLCSAIVGSFGTILQRRIKGVGTFELQAWVATVALPFSLAATFLFETGDPVALMASADWIEWGGIIYVAFASSLVGHAGIYWLLQRYEVSQTAPYTLLAPLFTVTFGVWLLGDMLTERMIIGGLITLAGVLIISMREKEFTERVTRGA
ncbi:DMT family transporter [Pyruvatibacter sp. HU-CL02332]|uniref:DMT family transporter n=1 Tax=Pyruvatibacter sp. HU-CL02332 TaxID=3127650 RepID=UPI003103B43F